MFTLEQRMNLRRAIQLNQPRTWLHLLSLARAVKAGTQFGTCFGYQG